MTQHTLKSNFETVLLPPNGVDLFDRSGAKSAARTLESDPALLPITGVHPAVIKIAMSAVAWFLAVAWFDFSGGPEVDLNLGGRHRLLRHVLHAISAGGVHGNRRSALETAKSALRRVSQGPNPHRPGNHAGQGCLDPYPLVAGVSGRCCNAHRLGLAPAILGGQE